jgi:hypothetical protein
MEKVSIIAVTSALIGLKITDVEVKTGGFDVGIGRRIIGFRITEVEFELPSLIILVFDLKTRRFKLIITGYLAESIDLATKVKGILIDFELLKLGQGTI